MNINNQVIDGIAARLAAQSDTLISNEALSELTAAAIQKWLFDPVVEKDGYHNTKSQRESWFVWTVEQAMRAEVQRAVRQLIESRRDELAATIEKAFVENAPKMFAAIVLSSISNSVAQADGMTRNWAMWEFAPREQR